MGIFRRLREWREGTGGTLQGPALGIDDTELTVTEDGGDWVAVDNNNNVVLRYDAAAGSWVMDSLKAGNVSLYNVTGNGLPAQAIEHGRAWADDGQLYDSIGSAENAASAVVIVGPGLFSETITVNTSDISIIGSGSATIVDGGADDAITIQEPNVEIARLSVKTTFGADANADCFDINNDGALVHNVRITESDRNGVGIFGSQSDCKIINISGTSNIGGETVTLGANTSGNLVDDIVGTVANSGSDNTVGDTV